MKDCAMSTFYTRAMLREIDDFIVELRHRLERSPHYDSLVEYVAPFVVNRTGKSLADGGLYGGDPSDIRSTIGPNGFADRRYAPNLPSTPEDNEIIHFEACKLLYLLLGELPEFCVRGTTKRRRENLIGSLLDVCEDYLELRGLLPSGEPGLQGAATEEWSAPMTKTEMARRITGRNKVRAREVEPFLAQHGLRHVAGRKFIVRLDTMDANNRRKLESPE